jgi:hypothetical protein
MVAAPAAARKKRTLPTWEWHCSAAVGTVYTSNVLGISEPDRDLFLRDPAAFPTPLEAVDDLQSEVQLHPEIRWRAPHQMMVSTDYRFRDIHRFENVFTSYQTHSFGLGLRPRTTDFRWSLRYRLFIIPSFYLRVYKDRDYNQRESARFRNWDHELSIRYRVLDPLAMEIKAARGTYYYNRKFTEYDSKYYDGTLGATYAFPWDMTIGGGYTRRISDNIGKDQPGATTLLPTDSSLTSDSEYGDADFHENELFVNADALVPWIKFTAVRGGTDFRYRRRVYTTNRPVEFDPFHRGRLDKRWEWTSSVTADIVSGISAQAYFTYESRHTDSPMPQVPLVKNFLRREFGLIFTLALK